MFTIAASNVLITLFYMIPGFILRKMHKASEDHLPTLSAILIYIGTPFLELKTFLSLEFSWDGLKEMGLFFVTTFLLMSLFMLIIFLIFRKKYDQNRYRILTIGSVFGNVGFFGLPIVTSLFPNDPKVTCCAVIFTVSMNILAFTVGVFCITGQKKYISVKSALINPSVLGFCVAFPMFLFGVRQYLPEVLINAINLLGSMTTPLCMFIIGIRLASAPAKDFLRTPMVYVISLMKLLVFPLFCYGIVYFLPFSPSFKACLLVLTSTPCASIINSLSEFYGKDRSLSANCILVSTLLCVFTIPLLTLLL